MSVVSNHRQKDPAEPLGSAGPRPPATDLLELVRSAEEEARLAIRKRTPAVPVQLTRIPGSPVTPEEEFVDVGDEAIDAPPSIPPMRAATPAVAVAAGAPALARPNAAAEAAAAKTLPPAFAIPLLLALTIGALALLAR